MKEKNVFIILIFILSGLQYSFAQQQRMELNYNNKYDENIYAISDYSGLFSQSKETLSFNELMSRQLDGFIFDVIKPAGTNNLSLIYPDGSLDPFINVLKVIRQFLEADTSKILTLFIDLDSIDGVEEVFEESGLLKYMVEQTNGNDWLTLREMANSDQRLVVFSIKHVSDSPGWLLDLDTYASWQISPFVNSSLPGDLLHDTHDKNFFIFNAYSSIERMWLMERNVNNIRLPFFIEPFKNVWITSGHIPNFILIDVFDPWIYEFFRTIRTSSIVQGTVTYNNEILDEVMWKGLNSTTEGLFSFPLMPGDKLELTPISSGYNITPESIAIDENYTDFPVSFKATPMSISEGIEVFLQLDNDVNNYDSKKNNGAGHNIKFVTDPIRGLVASFGEGSKIDLPTAKDLNITDHDFTIAVWVKVSKYLPNRRDYCIVGAEFTENVNYLKRMHFLIRDKKPYFGFFANDITGNTNIEAGKWYHLACRFNSVNGEQAIFVNGKLDSRSYNLPSYKGSDSLFVGIYSQNTYFNGAMDNLTIWSRALGDKEILGISNGLLSIDTFNTYNDINYFAIFMVVIIIIIISLVIIFFVLRHRQVKSSEKLSVEESLPKMAINYIRLFGDFLVIDKNGNDITSKFSPKIKQLFLAILVNSGNGNSGISAAELSKYLWGKDSSKDTDNLRGVTIRKLRGILDEMDKVDIVFHAERWSIQFSGNVYCDYVECMKLIQSNKVYQKRFFNNFLDIVSAGELFKNESFIWLDSCKGFLSSSIVDVLLKCLDEADFAVDKIKIANCILVNDPVNDTALAYKIDEMISNNNRTLARYSFDQFRELYQILYGEKYLKSFDEFVEDLPSKNAINR